MDDDANNNMPYGALGLWSVDEGADVLVITNSGSVGIGTTNPNTALHVHGATTILKISAGVSQDVTLAFDEENSGTLNGWLKWDAGDNLLQLGGPTGGNVINYKDSTGFIGIGTTNPASLLHTYGGYITAERSSKIMYINPNYSALNTHGQVSMDTGDSMDLSLTTDHGDDTQLYMTFSKRLGVGTTSPLSRLHIRGHVSESNSGSLFRVEGSSGSLFEVVDSLVGSLMSVNDISGLPILEVFDTDKVVMGSFNQNTLVVTGSKVGIGLSDPSTNLVISGSATSHIKFDVSNAYPLIQTSYSGGSLPTNSGFEINNTGGSVRLYATQQIVFRTSGADPAMTIVNGGYVGIGTTNPSYPLTVRGNPAVIELVDSGGSEKS
jgi:hypothetical protein